MEELLNLYQSTAPELALSSTTTYTKTNYNNWAGSPKPP